MATNRQMLQNLIRLRIKNARENLIDYALHVSETYIPEDFHYLLADAIEAAINGKISRLMVQIGPRHGKSELLSRILPGWYLAKYPGMEIILATYGQTLVEGMGRDARTMVDSKEFRDIFPYSKLNQKAQSKTDWEILHQFPNERERVSKFFGTSIGGVVTGKGANLFLIDDYFKDRAEANSATVRQSLWDWYCSASQTRLAFKDSPVIILATQWHEDGLCGRLLQSDIDARQSGNGHLAQGWYVLKLPSVPDERVEYEFFYEKYARKVPGGKFVREKGQPLYPPKFDLERYEKIKQLNPSEFESLYQQNPVSSEGELFKKKEWHYKHRDEFPDDPLMKIISFDTSATDSQTADYSVGTFALFDGLSLYITKRTKNRFTFPALRQHIIDCFEEFKPDLILIEYKSSGIDLVNDLMSTRLPIKPIKLNNTESKLSRALSITPMQESGRIILPSHEENWTEDYLSNFTKFPNGKYDDEVDSLSQLGRYVSDLTANSFFIDDVSKRNQFPGITPHESWPIVCSINIPRGGAPFSVLFFCTVTTVDEIYGIRFPIGTTIVFAEIYGVDKDNSTTGFGLSCTPEDICAMIQQVEDNFDIRSDMYYVNDSIQSSDPMQEDPYSEFMEQGLIPYPLKLDHRVSAPYLKNRLKNRKKPLFITSNCKNLWRVLPFIQRDTTGSQVFMKGEETSIIDCLMIGLNPFVRGDHTAGNLDIEKSLTPEQSRFNHIFNSESVDEYDDTIYDD